MYYGIGIEREPVTQERQPPGEIELTETRARIVPRKLLRLRYILKAEKALEEGMKCDGLVAGVEDACRRVKALAVLAAPYYGAAESELEILCRFEVDLFGMLPRLIRVLVTWH